MSFPELRGRKQVGLLDQSRRISQPGKMSHQGTELGILSPCSGSHYDSFLSLIKVESLTESQVSPAVWKTLLDQGTRQPLTSNGHHFEASPLQSSVGPLSF